MYHIHVDATELSDFFACHLEKTGFIKTDFCGHPDGAHGFEPPHHLTLKTQSASEFRKVFDEVVKIAETSGDSMTGYLEGEYVAFDEVIPQLPYNEVALPFVLSISALPPGVFRETELHIDVCRDRSNPAFLRALAAMGLFSAYLPKPYGVAQIFTVQGTRQRIDALLPPLRTFLQQIGGAVAGSMKEERVVRWWRSGPDVSFPPTVVDWSILSTGGRKAALQL
jgi:hypothetical protein